MPAFSAPAMLVLAGLGVAVAGCGRVDSHATYFPESWRQPSPEPAPAQDPQPDAARLICDNLTKVFTETSQPSNVQVSSLRRNAVGAGWNVCVRATVLAINKSTMVRTYVVPIERGEIGLRRTAVAADGCDPERFTRI